MAHAVHARKKDPAAQRLRMLEAPIPPLVCSLALPTIVSMLVTSIYNMADTYFVSQINTSASGAVGIVFSIMAIIQAVGFTVGMGAGSTASRLLGKERGEEANTFASTAVFLALVLGLLLSLLGLCRLDGLIWALGSTQTIYPYAREYAGYILVGAPVMVLAFTLNNLLRWQGLANLAVIGLATGGVLNILLDPLFIFGLNMGIGGAGAAPLLSQCVSLAILASFFFRGMGSLRVRVRDISRKPEVYATIFKQGMPSFFRQGVVGVSTMALNFNARLYGDAAVAAMSIVTKVFVTVQSVVIGFGQGFQPVLGFNFGAGRLDRVKRALVFSIQVCTAFLIVAAVAGYIFAPAIVTEFRRSDPQVIAIGTRAFRAQCFSLPLLAVCVFANMYFQSVGKAFRATILAVCRNGVMIPLVYVLCWRFGLTGLEWTQTLADVVSFAKGIAGGLPMGGFLVNEKCRPVLGPGSHASTFGGNPVCSAAALAVLDILDEAALNRVREKGAYLREHIEAMGKQCLGATRGLGLMIGIELAFPAKAVWEELIRRGFICNLSHEVVLRLLPALNIPEEDLRAFADTLEDILANIKK